MRDFQDFYGPVYQGSKCIGQVLPVASRDALGYGIADHSKPATKLAIISAWQPQKSEEDNRQAHENLRSDLYHYGVHFGEVAGCYLGNEEQAFLCEVVRYDDGLTIAMLSRYYQQESVLYISEDRDAQLTYTHDGTSHKLGKLVPVPMSVAVTCDAWTRTNNGQYYVTR